MSQERKKSYELLVPNYPSDDRYEEEPVTIKTYKVPTGRPVRIYCDGIFDLFHYGHSRLFEQVKGLFPDVHVIVGVCNDELTLKYKGNLVMNEKERYESVKHCRYVDEVIEDAPWVLDLEFLKKHRIDFVAHDEAPYAHAGMEDLYKFVKERGMFIPTKRAKKISTTGLITRIIRDYEMFLKRQILRGISYKDLNISFFKRQQIKLKNSVISDVNLMKEEFKYALCYWEDLSKKMIQKFKTRFFEGAPKERRNLVSRMFNIGNSKNSYVK